MSIITTTTSKMWSLNTKDFLRGLLMTAIGGGLATMVNAIRMEGLSKVNWAFVLDAAIVAGGGYLLKNLLTPGEVVLQNAPEATINAVKEGAAELKVVPATGPNAKTGTLNMPINSNLDK